MLLAYKLWPTQRDSERARDKILLLHGMGGTGALWRPIAATLENDFDILAPDQRGHGGSIVPTVPGARSKPGYSPLDYGRDVIETMESLAFHPAWVVGHSMGVRSACGAAFLKPEWVRGLVLVDLGFPAPPAAAWAKAWLISAQAPRRVSLARGGACVHGRRVPGSGDRAVSDGRLGSRGRDGGDQLSLR